MHRMAAFSAMALFPAPRCNVDAIFAI